MRWLSHIRHRCVRVYQSYFPRPLSTDEHKLVKNMLEGELLSLYYDQPLCDQRHGILVFRKSQKLFAAVVDGPSEYELFIAGCFHDIAKKDSHLSVSGRIIAAMLLSIVPKSQHQAMLTSRYSYVRRLGIYANHADLSWEMIRPYVRSDFVRLATISHHAPDSAEGQGVDPAQVALFIEADTL